jgi:hypothetical protein
MLHSKHIFVGISACAAACCIFLCYAHNYLISSICFHIISVLCFIAGTELCCAVILERSMGARNRVRIGLSYRPARLHRLAESIPRATEKFKNTVSVYYVYVPYTIGGYILQ